MKKVLFFQFISKILKGILLVCALLFTYLVVNKDYDDKIPLEKQCAASFSDYNFASLVDSLNSSITESNFPYNEFLSSESYCDAATVKYTLNNLNKINPSREGQNRDILTVALTDKLENFYADRFKNFNADSLIIMLQWASEFKAYEEFEKENSSLYGIIHHHWMNFVSNQLSQHYKEDKKIKYDFKFRHLQALCQSKKYAPSVGKSKLDKIVQYTLSQEYCYLFNRFWKGTGFSVKFLFGIVFSTFVYMAHATYKYTFKK